MASPTGPFDAPSPEAGEALVCEIGADGRLVRASGAAARVLVGCSLLEVVADGDRAATEAVLGRVRSGTRVDGHVTAGAGPDGASRRTTWSFAWNADEQRVLAVGRPLADPGDSDGDGDIDGLGDTGRSPVLDPGRVPEEQGRRDVLHRTLAAARMGTWVLDTGTGTAEWSDVMAGLFGLAPRAHRTTLAAALVRIHPGDRDRVEASVARSVETGVPYVEEYRVVRPDGAEVWIRSEGTLDPGGATSSARLRGVAYDVTARRASEDAVRRASEQTSALAAQQSAILGQVAEGVIVTDPDGRITFVNDVAHRLHGVARLDVTPDAYSESYHLLTLDGAPYPPHALPLARAVLRDETVVDAEWRIRRPDGSEIIAQGSATPVRGDDGTRLGAVLTMRDVTESRALEARLRVEEQRYRSLVEATAAIVWTMSAAGEFETEQPGWSAFTGQSTADMLGWGWLDAVHPEDRSKTERAWRVALAGRVLHEAEHRLRRRDGVYRDLLVRAVPIVGEDGEVEEWVGVNTDVTERRQAEDDARRLIREQAAREAAEAQAETLRRAAAELERSNRDLQEFAYVASHDLQEPLRKIQSFAGLLAVSPGVTLDDEGRHFVGRMQAAAERMSSLIRDLLSLSRVSTRGAFVRDIDLEASLRAVLVDLESRIEQSAGRVDVERPLPTVTADPVQMQQLLLNLVGNGLKFHRAGVPPVVRVSGHRPPGGVVEIVVEDNGIGFEPRYAERIFGPFQRLHPREVYEGTGMGLAIVRRIVERHGGRISASAVAGEGARFVVTLPQHPGQAAESAAGSATD